MTYLIRSSDLVLSSFLADLQNNLDTGVVPVKDTPTVKLVGILIVEREESNVSRGNNLGERIVYLSLSSPFLCVRPLVNSRFAISGSVINQSAICGPFNARLLNGRGSSRCLLDYSRC